MTADELLSYRVGQLETTRDEHERRIRTLEDGAMTKTVITGTDWVKILVAAIGVLTVALTILSQRGTP